MLEYIVGFLGTALIGVFSWAVSLNSRISVLEQKGIDMKDVVGVKFEAVVIKFEAVVVKFDAINHRLDRIEKVLNGFLTHKA